VKLPEAEQRAPEWQAAAEMLMSIGESGGDPTFARIPVLTGCEEDQPRGCSDNDKYPQSSMAFGGGIAALAIFAIGKTVYDRLRPRHRQVEDSKTFWNTIGSSAFVLFAGLVFIGIGLREYYRQPLQHLWPLRFFWPQD
jgi:hypothetical protein